MDWVIFGAFLVAQSVDLVFVLRPPGTRTYSAMVETADDAAFNKGLEPVYDKSEVGAQGEDERWTRISFVCYVREKLADCDTKETEAYYKRIHFDPETGSDESK